MEFCTALLSILDEREKDRRTKNLPFEPLDLSKLHLILRSPAGLIQNLTDCWRQVCQIKELLTSMNKPSYSQMETIMNFPPVAQGESFLAEAWRALHVLYPEASHQKYFNEKYSGIVHAHQLEASSSLTRPFLDNPRFATIQKDIASTDQKLWEELQNKPWNEHNLRSLFETRHKILEKAHALSQVLNNTERLLTGDAWEKKHVELSGAAFLALPRLLKQTFFGFGNKEIYRWLRSRGAKISLLAPDAEVFAPLQTLEEFFGLEDKKAPGTVTVDNIVIEPGTHISMTGNTSNLANALKALHQQAEKI